MERSAARESRAAWEAIARSFDRTRRKPWPIVLDFLDALPPRCRMLDAGTGNGRHAVPAAERGHAVVGVDFSRGLLEAARANTRGARPLGWVLADLERPPFRRASFDAVLALAVLHHVRGRENRRACLAGLLDLVRPGGRLLLSVWLRDQPSFQNPENPLRPPASGPVEPGDAMLRWSQHGLDVERFIHLYEAEEFHRELRGLRTAAPRVWTESIASPGRPDNAFARFDL